LLSENGVATVTEGFWSFDSVPEVEAGAEAGF